MTSPQSRLSSMLQHLIGSVTPAQPPSVPWKHPLTPTLFLERAAAIEPDAEAIVHITADGRPLRRTYAEFADRARALAWFLAHHGYRRVGILAPNTPAFLETIYGAGAAGAVLVPANYRLIAGDVAYVFDWGDVDVIVADAQFASLLTEGPDNYAASHPGVPILVDADTDAGAGELRGRGGYDAALAEGLQLETETRRRLHAEAGGGAAALGEGEATARAWDALRAFVATRPGARPLHEDDVLAVPFTSGTTARPKGVEFTHRGAYLAALSNVAESGLNGDDSTADDEAAAAAAAGRPRRDPRCRYLWTLPMFHAVGWTFPWAVCAVRGTHVCLRKIDYPLIWRLLRDEGVTHFNAAPTVNTLLCAAPEAVRLDRPVRVTVAASPPTGVLFEQMTKLNLRPVHVYGMTETYGPITRGYVLPAWDRLPPHEKFERMARQGHGYLTSLPARVIRTDEDGEANAAGGALVDVPRDGKTIGEIVFSGNICCRGYYKDPEATAKLFAGGVLHSGDLAVWHPDGSVQILDRSKDIIISGGENISSVALESILVGHPDVLEAAVVAVSDTHWGERPKAYLTMRPAAAAKLDSAAFLDWVKNQSGISRFMVPREVEVVKELPKTSTGKLQKNVLREWAAKGTPAEARVE